VSKKKMTHSVILVACVFWDAVEEGVLSMVWAVGGLERWWPVGHGIVTHCHQPNHTTTNHLEMTTNKNWKTEEKEKRWSEGETLHLVGSIRGFSRWWGWRKPCFSR
jgi:hypothetical protein